MLLKARNRHATNAWHFVTARDQLGFVIASGFQGDQINDRDITIQG